MSIVSHENPQLTLVDFAHRGARREEGHWLECSGIMISFHQFFTNRTKTGLLQLLAAALLLFSQTVEAQQSFSSRGELQRWEQRIQEQIRSEKRSLAGQVKDRNLALETARRQTQAKWQRYWQDQAEEWNELIRKSEVRIAELEAQLANPPPVIDERERQEEAARQRQEQLTLANRQQQDRLTQEREQLRQSQEQFRTWQDNRQKEQSAQFDRQKKTVDAFGKGLNNTLQEMIKPKQNDDHGHDDRSSREPPLRQFVVTDPNLRASSSPAQNQSRVAGNLDEMLRPEPQPEPAKPLFDSPLAQFLVDKTKEVGGAVADAALNSLANGGDFDPVGTARDKAISIGSDLLLGTLPEETQRAIRKAQQVASGEYYEAAMDLMPEDKRLEARAARLPFSVVTGKEGKTLAEIWDKEVVPKADAMNSFSPTTKSPEGKSEWGTLVDISQSLLDKSRPQLDAESQIRVKREPGTGDFTRWGPATGAGPLGPEIANTFRSGTYTEYRASQAATLYRVYDGESGKFGSYWTPTPPTGWLQSGIDGATGSAGGEKRTRVVQIRVPAGTTLYEGHVAPKDAVSGYPTQELIGGGDQVYLPNPDPAWEVK